MKEVRLIGGQVYYRDGSEQRVLEVLDRVTDRSSGSDELAAQIDDWPTTYHFSPRRANLLAPMRFRPGMRVLDVGAGTGALARHVGETGAEVVAIEGSLERAEAAARRCAGLDNVEVVSGSIAEFDDHAGFDVVLCVGVLEHTAPDHDRTLADLRRLTRSGGVLALAIENQLGLRYLLGYEEDHVREPWAGVEGYPGTTHVRTFSRARLSRMLHGAGFPAQRWLLPFPDYKLPTVVLDEACYRGPEGPGLVDQLVRWPCSDESSPATRLCDDRLAHGVFLDADLGPDVANSFLVMASDTREAVDDLVGSDVVAWFMGGERLRQWRSPKAFLRTEEGPSQVVSTPAAETHSGVGWLRQRRQASQPFFKGRTLEQRFLEGCTSGREDAEGVLHLWREHLRESETRPGAGPPPREWHPFRHGDTRVLLPSDHLDVNLSNFIDVDGDLAYVDSEWVAPSEVDANLALLRALWGLAADLVVHGVHHPWPQASTVDELAAVFCGVCGLRADAVEMERWRVAEANLLTTVHGGATAAHLAWLRRTGARAPASDQIPRTLPFTALRRELAGTQNRLATTRARLDASKADVVALRHELVDARARSALVAEALEAERRKSAILATQLKTAREARTAAEAAGEAANQRAVTEQRRALDLESEVAAHVRRWLRVENQYPVRIYRRVRGYARVT